MKWISFLILCLSPICFFAHDNPSQALQTKDMLKQTSDDLKEAFEALKNDNAHHALSLFSNVMTACHHHNFAHKHSIMLAAMYGWAISLDQLDQIEKLYEFVGKSVCDLVKFSLENEDFDINTYIEEVFDLIFDDECEDFLENIIDMDEIDFAKLLPKAKNDLIRKLLEIDSTEFDCDDDDDE